MHEVYICIFGGIIMINVAMIGLILVVIWMSNWVSMLYMFIYPRMLVYSFTIIVLVIEMISYCQDRSLSRNTIYNIHESNISLGLAHAIGYVFVTTYIIANNLCTGRNSEIIIITTTVTIIGLWMYGVTWMNDLWQETYSKVTRMETQIVITGVKWLILSELMLFIGCFWGVVNFRMNAQGLYILSYFPLFNFNALSIPLTNLIILLYSTLPCQSSLLFIKLGIMEQSLDGIAQTILCGVVFITLQIMEFLFSLYTISDLIVGSIFYFTTSIHGLHVIIGCIGWLIILMNSLDCYSGSNTSTNASTYSSPSFFSSFALSPFLWSYYWHFVDLIWLIVFMLLVL